MKEVQKGFDYIGITCVFFCHDGQGNLLLHKRGPKCRDEVGVWDPGGGGLDFGEDFEDCTRREIKEEYDADVLDIKFLGTKNVLRNLNGRNSHWIALIFLAQVDPTQVKINEPEKMDEIGWFTPQNLPRPVHTQFDRFFEELVKPHLNP